MRNFFVLLLFCFYCFLGYAQEIGKYKPSSNFKSVQDPETSKIGFENAAGVHVIKAQFDKASFDAFSGEWIVEKDSLYGFFSADGKIYVPPQFKWYVINDVENSGQISHIIVKKDNLFGIIDYSGKWLVPAEYPTGLMVYKYGYVWIKRSTDYQKKDAEIIDKNGKIALSQSKLDADDMHFCESYDLIHKAKSPAEDSLLKAWAEKNKKYALFTVQGKQLTEYKYETTFYTREKFSITVFDNCVGMVDDNDKVIVPFIYENMWYEQENKAFVSAAKNDSLFYYDRKGNLMNKRKMTEKELINYNGVKGTYGTPLVKDKDGKPFTGQKYIYGKNGLLMKIAVYKNGIYIGDAPLDDNHK